jgi:phosphotransferase family enzyme
VLGAPARALQPLGNRRPGRRTWAAGELVVKARRGDCGNVKTGWAAEHLPRLAARGIPVPELLWHGPVAGQWHMAVQRRLPGEPAGWLDEPLLHGLIDLIERQADAGIDPDERDLAAYQSFVLFDGWDHVWVDAERASAGAARLCGRLRRWLEPVAGQRAPARDYVHTDLNLTNVLTADGRITGIVDWDELGLGCRAGDLVALAVDCERDGNAAAAAALLARAAGVAGDEVLRLHVGYRVIALLAAVTRRGEVESVARYVAASDRVLDRLGAE